MTLKRNQRAPSSSKLPSPAMAKPGRPSSSSHTNLASCIVATVFLILVGIVIAIVFFTLFKPKEPKISVNAVQLPAFSLANNTATFTFSQYASVNNPNRDVFSHYDSSLQLLYAGNQVGFMFIPAGKIDSGRTQYMSATFSVQSFPLMSSSPSAPSLLSSSSLSSAATIGEEPSLIGGEVGSGRIGPTMEIESEMRLAGRVRVLRFLTHHVESKARCRVAIGVSDGSVLGFHC